MWKTLFYHFQPETLGFTVSGLLGFIGVASYVEMINGMLQTLVLISSIVVSICTVVYLRKKTKKL